MEAETPLRRQTPRRGDRPAGTKPLRRRPKELDAEPDLFDPGPGAAGDGIVFTARARRRDRGGSAARPGGGPPGATDEAARVLDAVPADGGADPETLRRARQIALRLAVPRARRDLTRRRGTGELMSVRYSGGSDDIDLDATLERLAGNPVPEDDDIIVRERVRTRRSIVLVVDVSGSMRGERVRTAAATVGALVGRLADDDLAVIAFWSDAAIVADLGPHPSPAGLIDTLLRIPAQGLTNVGFPLEVAHRQLARVPARDARVLLLSDCVHNAGPDPRFAAARLPRLDVLVDTSGEHDAELARDLARLGHGRRALVQVHRDVAPAVSQLLAR